MHHLIIDMIKKLKTSKKKIDSLEDDKELLSEVVTTEKRNNKELSLKLDEPRKIVNVVDTTLVETLNCEILDTKNKVTELEELKMQLSMKLNGQFHAMSLKNAEIKVSNEKISIFEEKCLNLEKALSTLKGKEKVNETSVSFSPNIQLEKELNTRIEGLLLENSKLQKKKPNQILMGLAIIPKDKVLCLILRKMCQRRNPTKSLRRGLLMHQNILLCKMTCNFLMNHILRKNVIFVIVLVT